MRVVVPLLLLVGAVPAAEPGFKDVFDPRFAGDRSSAFKGAVARSGIARAIRHYTGFEAILAAAQKRLDKQWKAYAKIADDWWDWRRKYEAAHQKKYKRPPVDYPVPQGLNKSFIDQELALKKARATKLKEQLMQDAFLQRTHELLATLEGPDRAKAVAAAAKGLKDKNPHQRIRCARFLETLKAGKQLELGLSGQKHPVVLQEMLAALGRTGTEAKLVEPYLNHAAWPVRAGAIAALGSLGATAALESCLTSETGRLRDDIAAALKKPPAGEVEFFGGTTGSRALVFCLDGTIPGVWDTLVEAGGASIDTLPDGALFGVVVFDRKVKLWKKKLQAASAGTRADAKRFLGKHKPTGGANLHAGLMAALDLAAARGKAPAVADTIFLATIRGSKPSLMDRTSTVIEDPRQVALEVTKRNETLGVRIHAFGRSEGRDSFYLQTITGQFGGTHLGPK